MGLPPDLASGPFLVRAGVAAGVSVGRLRNAQLARPYWGVRSTSAATDTVQRAHAFALRMPPRSFFMHATAAALHGLPLPRTLAEDRRLDIGVPAGQRRVTTSGVVSHHVLITDDDLVTDDGVRLTSVERTWVDLAASGALSLAHLVAVGDAIIWRKGPASTPTRIAAARRRYRGRRGVRTMDVALSLLCDRSDSPPESMLRVAIWARGLPTPQVNRAILDGHGRFIATPDFSWPEHRVLLEYEGDHHRTDREQWHRDLARYATLEDEAWRVLRASAADLRAPARLLDRLARLLRA